MRKEITDVIERICDNAQQMDKSVFRFNISLLRNLLKLSNLDFYEKGLIYWQLQDHYALLRDFDNEVEIFKEFTSYVRKEKKSHLFWTVCDMTQALTMRLGGYNEVWDKVYNECMRIETNSNELVRMKFEMLRAYVGIFTDQRVLIDNSDIELAIERMDNLIIDYSEHPDNLFFRLCFYVSVIKYSNFIKKDYSDITIKLRNEVHTINLSLLENENDILETTLFGSWNQISMSIGNYYTTKVGLTNVLFALVEANDIKTIEYLISNILNYKFLNKRLVSKLKGLGVNI